MQNIIRRKATGNTHLSQYQLSYIDERIVAKMATVKVEALLCSLFLTCAIGQTKVQLSSNLEENAGACVGEQVTFVCTGNSILLMRWIMEPFVESSDPVTFNPTLEEGSCFKAQKYDQLTFCLRNILLSSDNATASMTTNLTFVAMKKINGISLDGTIVKCNDESAIFQINKDPPPPPIRDLDCSISASGTFCDNFTSTVVCIWTLIPHIKVYKFNITSKVYGQLSPQMVTANTSMQEFTLICSDSVDIVAFAVNNCNTAGKSTSKHIPGNCSECNTIKNYDKYSGQDQSLGGYEVAGVVIGFIILVIAVIIILIILFRKNCQSKTKITWIKCEDFPVKMSHMHVVKIDDKLYCGGGYTGYMKTSNKVFTCNCMGSGLDQWKELPGSCPVIKFALTHYTIDDQVKLVTVGGRKHGTKEFAVELYVHSTDIDDENAEWKSGLSPLPIHKYYSAALNYRTPDNKEYIIACGGIPYTENYDNDVYHSNHICSDTIEIFDGEYWIKLDDTIPMKRSCLSLANIGDRFYIVGGGSGKAKVNNDVAVLDFQTKICYPMNSCPLAGSTAVVIKNKLLVIGGKTSMGRLQSLIWKPEVKQSVYAFSDGKWEKVQVHGNAPNIYMAAAKKISNDEFILVGGHCQLDTPEASVYIGKLTSQPM